MSKYINDYTGLEYYAVQDEDMKISDIIDVLQRIRDKYGEIYVRIFNDGILKGVSFCNIRQTEDKTETCVELTP